MKNIKNNKMLLGIGVVFLFLATVSLSYAYFSVTVTNKDVKDQVVKTGTLELTYTDGPQIIMENIKPGATLTKEISVKNTGTLDTSYNLVWQELVNGIDMDELVMSATCQRLNTSGAEEKNCEGFSDIPVEWTGYSGDTKPDKILRDVSIESGITHKYVITITFVDTNENQYYNEGQLFTGTFGIEEYKVPQPVYCTYDGTLEKGAEFKKGLYTYRYMQEEYYDTTPLSTINDNSRPIFQNNNLFDYNISKLNFVWKDMIDEGWGVTLTDKDSTDAVTEAPCTFINDKPVVSMAYMFSNSRFSSLDTSNFNTSNVTNMKGMFSGFHGGATIDLSGLDTSNVTDMSNMFYKTYITYLNLRSFDTSSVTNMSGMFYYNNFLRIIYASSKFVTINVTDSTNMFMDSMDIIGGAGTEYDSNHTDSSYARIDGGTENPGYFTAKGN